MQKTNRLKFGLILLTFILPLLISVGLYYYQDKIRFKTLNEGIFIQPPISLHDLDQPVLLKQWQIVYYPSAFNASVLKQMFLLHQMYLALNKNSYRVSLTLWTESKDIPKILYGFNPILFTEEQNQKLQKKLTLHNKFFMSATNKIYLIDPVGNLFMYYPDDVDPTHILKDLKRLLEVSQIG